MKKITLSEKNAKIIGRVYFDETAAWLGLSGTGAEFDFKGKELSVTILGDNIAVGDNEGSFARVAVYVDGKRVVDDMVTYSEKEYSLISSQEEVSCRVLIIKLTESPMSAIAIKCLAADDGAEMKPVENSARKIEFIGDSITCGYGVDDEDENHQFSTATEDVTRAYAYKTAKALDADYSMFSASGYGIITGYTEGDVPLQDQILPQFYDSYGFSRGDFGGKISQDIAWEFARYVPDLIVINLGTNDDSYCRDYQDRQDDYSAAYTEFLKKVRSRNPNAYILCTVGIMGQRIFKALEKGVAEYVSQSGDVMISTMMFDEQNGAEDGFAANWHPTEKTHTKAAAALTAKIKEIMKW